MKIIALFFLSLIFGFSSSEKTRQLEYNGTLVMTTWDIERKFLGKYKGSKKGFLQLEKDGSGVYRYDYPGLSPDCHGEQINFNWGFILDESGQVVKLERSYGYSYPIIYNCSGENAFQGCTRRNMIDFILVYKDGTITISSSDDWVKTGN